MHHTRLEHLQQTKTSNFQSTVWYEMKTVITKPARFQLSFFAACDASAWRPIHSCTNPATIPSNRIVEPANGAVIHLTPDQGQREAPNAPHRQGTNFKINARK